MSETVLHAETGRSTGSPAARRLRNQDKIPAVVYGLGMEPLSISVTRSDLRQAVSGPAGLNTVLDLTVDGKVFPSIIKDLQRHPVRRTVQHVDFIQIDLDRDILVNVPVRITGEAKEVVQNNAMVDIATSELEVWTTPRAIPDEFLVDVSEMTMDSVIRVEDIDMPTGVSPTADPDSPVVTVLTMRTPVLDAEEAEREAEEAELLGEGLEGEGAEGEAAQSADADSGDTGDE
jgi:large subunit ribosomal protein L25